MIEINLIPDVKKEFLKKQNSRRIVVTIAALVSIASIALVVIMFIVVTVVQGRHTTHLEDDIASLITEFQAPENVSKVLTVDDQLRALPQLHEGKPDLTRLDNYLSRLIPSSVTIDNMQIDIAAGTLTIRGQADAPVEVDRFINVLKNAVYFEVPDDDAETIDVYRVFTATALSNISPREDGKATFGISSNFDTKIFSNGLNLKLTIPTTSSDETEFITPEELTRIEEGYEERQNDLFKPNDEVPSEDGANGTN